MDIEMITKEDLRLFRIQLLSDIIKLLERNKNRETTTEWVKSKQVREMLHVSPGTLQNMRITGSLHGKKIGGSWYYNKVEIDSLFTGNPKTRT